MSDNLRATTVAPVNTRVAQQVRNELLFALHGGTSTVTPRYQVRLAVKANASALSIRSSSLAPTSARVIVNATYTATEIGTNRVIARGTRRTFAAYDRTTQSFANERAERDAENRAAKEVAQQIRLALTQQLSGG
ncbi:MAG: LPS assembly lipoprotein LptE [Pseudomonadota bacterium]